MLKKIIFILSEYYYTFAKEHFPVLNRTMLPHKASVTLLNNGSDAPFPSSHIQPQNFPETLFITDTPDIFASLFEKGAYTVVLYHENNKHCSFPGASYAIEDILQLEYSSYEEAYRRLAGIPLDILETERLLVRESTLSDIPDFYCIYQNPSVTAHMEPLYPDPDMEKAYLQDYIRQVYGFYGFGIWTVLLKETSKIIGRAGLNIREGYDLPELGFVIDSAFQGRGLAYEVCSAILEYAHKELDFDCIQAFVQKENIPSIKLLEKLGFTYNRKALEKEREYLLYIIQLK